MQQDTATQNRKQYPIAQYASELRKNETPVLAGAAGTLWVAHESLALMRIPSCNLLKPARREIRRVFRQGRAAMITYIRTPDKSHRANAWLYICTDREYSLDRLPAAMRRNVRRGLRELRIGPISGDEVIKHGVQAFCDTRRRVGLSDGTPEEFRRRFTARARCSGHIFLGAWKDQELAAFLSLTKVDDWVEIEGCFSMDSLLKLRPNDTLFYRILSHYLTEEACRTVTYGVSSVQSESNLNGLHRFKKKIGFEARPVHRVFLFHPFLRPFVGWWSVVILKLLGRAQPGNRWLKKACGAFELAVNNSIQSDTDIPKSL